MRRDDRVRLEANGDIFLDVSEGIEEFSSADEGSGLEVTLELLRWKS